MSDEDLPGAAERAALLKEAEKISSTESEEEVQPLQTLGAAIASTLRSQKEVKKTSSTPKDEPTKHKSVDSCQTTRTKEEASICNVETSPQHSVPQWDYDALQNQQWSDSDEEIVPSKLPRLTMKVYTHEVPDMYEMVNDQKNAFKSLNKTTF